MDERLAHLLRQRAAIADHLAWLDTEIARARPPAPAELTAAPPSGTPPPASPAAPQDLADPDRLITQFAAETADAPLLSKTGCWVFFLGILVLLAGGGVGAIYIFYR